MPEVTTPDQSVSADADHDAPPDPSADRIRALAEFLGRFAPAVGERRDGGYLADADVSNPAVLVARDDAMIAAFEAVERIARRS